MKLSLISTLILISATFLSAQVNMTADELLKKSIKYHDPKGKLLSAELTFDFKETRPNGADISTKVKCNLANETFMIMQHRDSVFIESTYNKGRVSFKVDGSEEISEEIINNYRLNDKRLVMMRNYYQYLWLLPQKLVDDGTIILQEVKRKDFFGKESLEIKVTYDPSVGSDIWYFYFHPEKYALIGYRFYHDEAANDGEYILLEGEATAGKVRIPKTRKWYTHKEDKFLGADILNSFVINKPK